MAGQDSDVGGEAQRKCVRCMQGVCGGLCVCVYYCRTFYKAVRVGEEESGVVCVCFITAGPITKLFAWAGESVEDFEVVSLWPNR